MCRFKSGIILKNRVVIAPGENDSHSDLLESLGIADNYIGATKTFVRAELVPADDAWWISPEESPEKWLFVVDQDIVPDWFEGSEYEKTFRDAVCDWWKAHVLVDQKIDELSSGYYRLKRCEVKKLCNDVKVLLDESNVGEMWGSSQVDTMRGSSQVGTMRESSQVGTMRESSQVGTMWESSQVGTMWESSQVGEMWESSQVGTMRESSQVGEMWGSSTARDYKRYPDIKIWVSPEGKFEMIAHKNKK